MEGVHILDQSNNLVCEHLDLKHAPLIATAPALLQALQAILPVFKALVAQRPEAVSRTCHEEISAAEAALRAARPEEVQKGNTTP